MARHAILCALILLASGCASNPQSSDRLEQKDKFPQSRSEIKRTFAEGGYVIVHVHAVQPIPEKAANSNGMF